jgi:hypothetical protein
VVFPFSLLQRRSVIFEKIGRLAETAATNVGVSRRGFLGRLGQSALGVAGVLAGLTATEASAKGGGGYVCCTWACSRLFPRGFSYTVSGCYPPGTSCSKTTVCGYGWGALVGSKTVSSCKHCY